MLSPLLFFFDPNRPWRKRIGWARGALVGGSWQSKARDSGVAAVERLRRIGCGCRSRATRVTWRNMAGENYAGDSEGLGCAREYVVGEAKLLYQ